MIDALSMDAIRTARAKGMSGFNVVGKQALRNALVPVITVVGLQFGQMLGGSILTESVFGWPGIGQLLVNSITNRDYPVVQGVVFVVAVMLILVNLATDLLYSAIDRGASWPLRLPPPSRSRRPFRGAVRSWALWRHRTRGSA